MLVLEKAQVGELGKDRGRNLEYTMMQDLFLKKRAGLNTLKKALYF